MAPVIVANPNYGYKIEQTVVKKKVNTQELQPDVNRIAKMDPYYINSKRKEDAYLMNKMIREWQTDTLYHHIIRIINISKIERNVIMMNLVLCNTIKSETKNPNQHRHGLFISKKRLCGTLIT